MTKIESILAKVIKAKRPVFEKTEILKIISVNVARVSLEKTPCNLFPSLLPFINLCLSEGHFDLATKKARYSIEMWQASYLLVWTELTFPNIRCSFLMEICISSSISLYQTWLQKLIWLTKCTQATYVTSAGRILEPGVYCYLLPLCHKISSVPKKHCSVV